MTANEVTSTKCLVSGKDLVARFKVLHHAARRSECNQEKLPMPTSEVHPTARRRDVVRASMRTNSCSEGDDTRFVELSCGESRMWQ